MPGPGAQHQRGRDLGVAVLDRTLFQQDQGLPVQIVLVARLGPGLLLIGGQGLVHAQVRLVGHRFAEPAQLQQR